MQRDLIHFEEELRLTQKLKDPKAREEYDRLFLGSTVRKLRRKMKMTQKELAKKLGTSQSAVARIEAGKQNFTLKTLHTIANIFEKKLQIKFL